MLTQSHASLEKHSTDDFMRLFVAGLVVKGRHHIWYSTDLEGSQHSQGYALCRYLQKLIQGGGFVSDDYQQMLVVLRNKFEPKSAAFFDGFGELAPLSASLTTFVKPLYKIYDLDLEDVTARCILDNESDPIMRELANGAVGAYIGDH